MIMEGVSNITYHNSQKISNANKAGIAGLAWERLVTNERKVGQTKLALVPSINMSNLRGKLYKRIER